MKNKSITIVIILAVIMITQACNRHKNTLPSVQLIIKNSGNEAELNKVIAHYNTNPSDSLKLEAAYFLIKNMKGWYYYKGAQLDHYQEYFKLIRRDEQHGAYFMHSFNNIYGLFSTDSLEKINDIEVVYASEIIDNIELSFKVWKEQPWNKNIDFNTFCEYILPFRIKDEVPEYNRKEIYEAFNPLLDSVKKANGDMVSAGKIINNALNQPQWLFTERTSFLPHFKSSQIIKYRAGACREMTDLAFYVMRAVGIPVAVDFVQQWPYRNMGHEFNVLMDNHKKICSFLGAEDSPGTPHKAMTKKGKVFRHIYETNPQSLASLIEQREEVPSFLKDKRIKDVTDEYASVHAIVIDLNRNGSVRIIGKQVVYLTVFDNKKWVPVDGAIINKGKASFKKMEGNIVYMPGYYHEGKVKPAGDPFILNGEGRMHLLTANHKASHKDMSLLRVFPITADSYDTWNIKDCQFQGANNPDFTDAVNLSVISNKPYPFWNTVRVNLKSAFRYVRFWSRGATNIGEIEFYAQKKKLSGRSLGTTTGWLEDKSFKRAFDGDILTDFDSKGSPTPTWAGLDFGTGQVLDSIRYSAPVMEDSTARVLQHHQYELFYWDKNSWVTAGVREATHNNVNFHAIPKNALYLLKDKSQPAEERIFTYTNGKQVWW